MQIDIFLNGYKEIENKLDSIKSDIVSKNLFSILADIAYNSVIENYAKQSSPSGVPWIQSERAKKDGGLTLIDSGKMLHSLTSIVGNDYAEVGYPKLSDKHIPQWLQEGHSGGVYPAREHLGLSDNDLGLINREVLNYFEGVLNG